MPPDTGRAVACVPPGIQDNGGAQTLKPSCNLWRKLEPMFSMEPIGYVRSPYHSTKDIPKGLGVKHEAEGVLQIRAEFEPGLLDIDGFSHLFVIWAFDRSEGFDLVVTPPSDPRPHG